MKVAALETLFCDAGWRPWIFLKATTDDGLVGWAEITDSHGSPRGLAGIVEDLAPVVVGKDPRATERIYWDLYRHTRQSPGSVIAKAIAGVENALLDVKAKALGVPVYELFGGPTREAIPVYWSHCGTTRARAWEVTGTTKLGSYDDVAALGREVVERGFPAFKTNVVVPGDEPQVLMPGFGEGGGTLRADEITEALVRLLEAFREGTGGTARPIVDLNFNLEPEGLVRVARALEPFDLLWLEVDLFDPAALAHVRHVAPMPICSGENLYGSRGFRPFLEVAGMDVASVDVIWNGFHQAKKIADLAETFEVNCAPHNYYSHLATFIAAQWCAVIPNARILEFDVDDVPWRDELVTALPEIADGEARVPGGPGWGVELREDVLREHPLAPAVTLEEVARRGGFAAVALALLVLDALVRLVAGEPYPGATVLVLAACGVSLLPFMPGELAAPSLRVAAVPPLALSSFAILLTTVSLLGIELTELSIRLAVAGLALAAAAAAAAIRRRGSEPPRREWNGRREGIAIAALAGIFAFAFAASYDVVDPFPPPGTDWAIYLGYADVAAANGDLSIDHPYAVGEGRPMGHYPGIGAVYGSLLILDGISSASLAQGISVVSALGVLSVYLAVGGLWGVVAGLLAAGAYAVAPIRLELMYWHGLGTAAALVFVPLVLLAVGRFYRGQRDRRTIGLLGLSLAAVAAVHSASAFVVAVLIALVLVAEVVRALLRLRRGSFVQSWWRDGITRPVLAGVGVACLVGAGVIVHLRRHAAELGSPVDAGFFDRSWFTADIVDYYYSWPFLALVGTSVVVVLWSRIRRGDPALAAIVALVAAAVVVSQLWRVEIPFEYRRVVYYTGPALVALIGLASFHLLRRTLWIAFCGVMLAVVARESIGLRLPERLLREDEPRSAQVDALASFREQLDRDPSSGDAILVADRCLGPRVQYIVRRPTLVSSEEWQVGFEKALPVVRAANAIVEGGATGRRLARENRVRYVLVDPRCVPDARERLGGEVAFANHELVVIEL